MKKLSAMVLIFGLAATCLAQSISPAVVSSAGAEGQAGAVQVSWTVGENTVSTLTSSTVVITEGFHQPFLAVESISSYDLSAEVKVYPNPTQASLWLEIERQGASVLVITLIDVSGKLISSQSSTSPSDRLEFDLTGLATGVYSLHLVDPATHASRSFSVQKIQ